MGKLEEFLREEESYCAGLAEAMAKKQGLLREGESIHCALYVIPLGVRHEFLRMAPQDYFTPERFLAAGISPKQRLVKIMDLYAQLSPEKQTMAEFLSVWTRREILRERSAGPGLVRTIATILERDGMRLT